MDGTALKRRVAHEIDALSAELREISLEIYSHPKWATRNGRPPRCYPIDWSLRFLC